MQRDKKSKGFMEWVDELGQGACIQAGQRLSRRGFIAQAGKVLGTALGVGIGLTALPVSRVSAASNCGMCGQQCQCCTGTNLCPSGSVTGSYWQACCDGYLYRYYDCCTSAASPYCPLPCWICPGGNARSWCLSSNPNYVCTKIQLMGPCA